MLDWRRYRLASQLSDDAARLYFALRWTDDLLQRLELPVHDVPIRDLEVQLDRAYWATRPPERLFDLTPREVLDGQVPHPAHASRIDGADLRWPLRLLAVHDDVLVLDGLHRLARAHRAGVATLPCVWVSPQDLGPDRSGA